MKMKDETPSVTLKAMNEPGLQFDEREFDRIGEFKLFIFCSSL